MNSISTLFEGFFFNDITKQNKINNVQIYLSYARK